MEVHYSQLSIEDNQTTGNSRQDLLFWLNDVLKSKFDNIQQSVTKIEQLGSGYVYCQLFDIIYPNKIQLGKVNLKAKTEYEFINNLKILQQGFVKVGIQKIIDMDKLIKCKYQDNYDLLSWFKKIYDSNNISFISCENQVVKRQPSEFELETIKQATLPFGNRNGSLSKKKSEITPVVISQISKTSSVSNFSNQKDKQEKETKENITPYNQRENKETKEIKDFKDFINQKDLSGIKETRQAPLQTETEISLQIDNCKIERDFCIQKLNQIELLIQNCTEQEEFINQVKKVLYSL